MAPGHASFRLVLAERRDLHPQEWVHRALTMDAGQTDTDVARLCGTDGRFVRQVRDALVEAGVISRLRGRGGRPRKLRTRAVADGRLWG